MKARTSILAAAVASILLAGASSAFAEDVAGTTVATKGFCKVTNNSCKGKGACASDKNDCAGKNACKGQGWNYHMMDNQKVEITKEECDNMGGQLAKK